MAVLSYQSTAHLEEPSPLHVFAIRAIADPQAICRIAGLFAQRNIVPHQICSRRSGAMLLIDIEVELESMSVARILLNKLRSMVLVERASLVGEGA